VKPVEYEFDGQPHFYRAETELRCPILKMIAEEIGQPEIGVGAGPTVGRRIRAEAGRRPDEEVNSSRAGCR
jgi:hypothetical protein